MTEGYIKIHRKILESAIFRLGAEAIGVLTILLLKANWKPLKWLDEATGEEILIPRGTFVTSRKSLSIMCGLSEQKIRTWIAKFKKAKIITSKSTSKSTIISILNYNKYQDLPTSQLTNTSTSHQPGSNQPSTTSKEVKEVKKERNTHSDRLDQPVGKPDWKTEPVRALAYAYKRLKGVPHEEVLWNDEFRRCLKPAKEILAVFDGNFESAAACMDSISEKLETNNFDWTLETIAKKAVEWKWSKHGTAYRKSIRLPQARQGVHPETTGVRNDQATARAVLNRLGIVPRSTPTGGDDHAGTGGEHD